MKKTIIISIIVLIAVISLYEWIYGVKTISDITPIRKSNVTKVVITEGNNGHLTTINNKDEINEFMSHIGKYRLKRDINQSKRLAGFDYAIDIYIGDRDISITFQNLLIINGTCYDIIKEDPNFLIKNYLNIKKGSSLTMNLF